MPLTIKKEAIKYKDNSGQYVSINAFADESIADTIETIEEVGEEYLSLIEQAADNAGYIKMDIVDGRLIYTRSNNLIPIDFEITNGSLHVEVE